MDHFLYFIKGTYNIVRLLASVLTLPLISLSWQTLPLTSIFVWHLSSTALGNRLTMHACSFSPQKIPWGAGSMPYPSLDPLLHLTQG